MPKFFIQQTDISLDADGKKLITLRGEQAYHLTRVLRVKPGTLITATDGQGQAYQLAVTKVTAEAVCGQVLQEERDNSEPMIKIILLQSILKGEKMDWVLQKGTEMGVSAFIPFISSRTIARPERKQYQKKQERWQKIVTAAAKQSGRGVIPTVYLPTPWARLPKILTNKYSLVAWENEQACSIRMALAGIKQPQEVFLMIGPEGGLAAAEVEDMMSVGAIPISLGPRILRAETAGPVTTALILYHFGQLEPVSSSFSNKGL